jgi:sulfite oxidase
VRSAKPFNAETPLPLLAEHPVTPSDVFYVRHHLPVPAVDDAAFKLSVGAG